MWAMDEDTLHTKQALMVSQSIYGVSLKLSTMFRYCHLRSWNSHTGYWGEASCWHHHIITVQGIRNDDQSLSPVTPLVCLLFLSFLIPSNVQEHFSYILTSVQLHIVNMRYLCDRVWQKCILNAIISTEVDLVELQVNVYLGIAWYLSLLHMQERERSTAVCWPPCAFKDAKMVVHGAVRIRNRTRCQN